MLARTIGSDILVRKIINTSLLILFLDLLKLKKIYYYLKIRHIGFHIGKNYNPRKVATLAHPPCLQLHIIPIGHNQHTNAK